MGTGHPIGKSHEAIGQSCCSGQGHVYMSSRKPNTSGEDRAVPPMQFRKKTDWKEM